MCLGTRSRILKRVNGKHITKLGYRKKAIGLALTVADALEAQGNKRNEILQRLSELKANPSLFVSQDPYSELAQHLLAEEQTAQTELKAAQDDKLRTEAAPYKTWGAELIDANAHRQMQVAMRLPSAVVGALMPDAHVGYGLPIGGVLATRNTVVPYAVGVDIGCSMMLSVLPLTERDLSTDEARTLLLKHTRFGAGVAFEPRERQDHPVLAEDAWQDQALLRHLHDKAAEQIGTSGSGNHFVEFGILNVLPEVLPNVSDTPETPDALSQLEPKRRYLAVLSHSGSRGFGAQVAGHFTNVAQKLHPRLHKEAQKLAWLDMHSEEGQSYWQAMSLAGRYALANHELIHERLTKALKVTPVLQVQNSHNLAWKQQVPSEYSASATEELIVHRKGATPAAVGQLGLIPSSMADPAYLVRGLGNVAALESASHGAGRQLGRRAARERLSKAEVQRYLNERDITLIGAGLDEAPQAYKSIERVLAEQTDLVQKVAKFVPRVVRMASE